MKTADLTDAWNGRALLTDLYQLTMAYGYWKSGRAEREAVFHLFFRKAPFQSGFTIAAGLINSVDPSGKLQTARTSCSGTPRRQLPRTARP